MNFSTKGKKILANLLKTALEVAIDYHINRSEKEIDRISNHIDMLKILSGMAGEVLESSLSTSYYENLN